MNEKPHKTIEFMLPSLRFNFRGVGKSSGRYDHGRGELDELSEAVREMIWKYLPV